MRTLIIDNYDSFTFNLFHYLAEVTGVRPVVIRNDEPGWTSADLLGFDNVVISPGPGRPDRPADFGVCADVIREGSRPLLGVCLGHQGICSVFGARIERAPEPVHGRQSPVLHEQVDILAGLPSPFAAVRYHSLMATRLTKELEAIGWTPDGVLMAVRHRRRPLWGVQFHPESICTAHGHRILANFVDLTRRWRSEHEHSPPRRHTTHAIGGKVTRTPPPQVRFPPIARPHLRVLHRSLPVDLPAEVVFDALYKDSEHSFWLDSGHSDTDNGRFSFMGDAAGPLARLATADVAAGQVTVRSATGVELVDGSFFEWIDADLAAHQVVPPDLPFDFALGWVGYLGYELKAHCGGSRAHRSPHPDAAMLFVDRAIAFDHIARVIHLLALSEDDDEQSQPWLTATAAALQRLAAQPRPPDPEPVGSNQVGPLTLRLDRSRYLELISTCQEQIAAGETYEVCLTNLVEAEAELDPWNTYRLLRRENPAPYGAFFRLDTLSVLGSSPERFLRVTADGRVESKPIKGTRPRGGSPVEDEWLRLDLGASEKDRAENLMIVDLVRHDLGTCAEVGSVRVERLFDVESYATVHQLVSTISAQLRSELSAVACIRASFPGGSMTGAPKVRTMAIIDELEAGPRGVYSGALGYFSLSGAADFSMVIRTLVLTPTLVEFGVGGAIIALSDPAAELGELAVKATPIVRLLGKSCLPGIVSEVATVTGAPCGKPPRTERPS